MEMFEPARKRVEDCAAVEVCKKLDNARGSCFAGSPSTGGSMQRCFASIILLLGKQAGLIE